jgi:predicted amidohydrolase YtcJ
MTIPPVASGTPVTGAIRLSFVLTGLVAVCACAPTGRDETARRADRVFKNGAVYTVDPQRSWARAVAISEGEILYVGDDAGAEAYVGPETLVTDLDGKMVLPGFHDSHAHLSAGGFLELNCNLTGLDERDAIRARLRECAKSPGAGSERWILGGGWELLAFPSGRADKGLLDEVSPDRPVYLVSIDGHSGWVNSAALRLAGITRETEDPPQGIIERHPGTGEPIGTLRDAAMKLAESVIPEASLEVRKSWVGAGIDLAHRFGITSLIEPGADEKDLEPYPAMSHEGTLDLRVLASISPRSWYAGALDESVYGLIAKREQFRGPNLNVDSVKVYVDGVIETRTATLIEPYIGRGYDRGEPFHTQELLDEYVRRFDREGLQVHVHAIGDGAVRMALDAFEAARKANGETDNRHHIVHLQLIHPDDSPRFAQLDVTATFQALWAWPEPWVTELALPLVGEERVAYMYPIGAVHRASGRIAGGSDWWVSSLNPLEAIETAVIRQDPDAADGPVLNEEERVDLATMLDAYTIHGAWLMRQEERAGSIEIGKRADLIVLDRNLFEIPPTEINEAKVLLTLFDGREVHRH